MNFQDEYKWWKPEKRKAPHEGIDFYHHLEGKINEKTKIPSLSDGQFVKIINDFIGQTVFIQNKNRVYIYSHIKPKIKVKQKIKRGQTIGTPSKSENPPTHFHLSVAQTPKGYPAEKLNWKTINQDQKIVLLNPINLIKHLTK